MQFVRSNPRDQKPNSQEPNETTVLTTVHVNNTGNLSLRSVRLVLVTGPLMCKQTVEVPCLGVGERGGLSVFQSLDKVII